MYEVDAKVYIYGESVVATNGLEKRRTICLISFICSWAKYVIHIIIKSSEQQNVYIFMTV